jgi:serine/threonine protein kinase
MATVYLADNPKHHRNVALKVLRPDLAATHGPERFLREVTIAANLQHPHILSVYDSGEVAGFLYYVMPFVEGESLRDRLTKHGELPLTDAARILRDLVPPAGHVERRHGGRLRVLDDRLPLPERVVIRMRDVVVPRRDLPLEIARVDVRQRSEGEVPVVRVVAVRTRSWC